ncbi:MAG: transcriptional repressor [Hyphomicrobiales bacterium]|nr:MAG: transcriptional repressor [Hyphomicrobiales bacterium]
MTQQSLERLLRRAGLRPTQKRLDIARLLFEDGDKHVTAEDVMEFARRNKVRVSQATVYNTLNQLCAAGLLKRIVLDGSRTFFDTNTNDHHHLFHEDDASLQDIPADAISILGLPELNQDETLRSVEIMVRVGRADGAA